MIFMLDNYDSFTYNLVQYMGELGAEMEVARNDKTTTEAVLASKPAGIVISPGPCTPNEAGISNRPNPAGGRQDSGSWGLPRPPVHRPGVRRQRDTSGYTDAREDLDDPPQRQRCVCWPRESIRRDTVPFVDRRSRALPIRPRRDGTNR